jgi:hypothetical protein
MNPKRLAIAIVVCFLGAFATDFLIHGVWLKDDYAASMSLWRPEAEMQKHMLWVFAGELLASIAAVMIWAKGFAEKGCPRCGAMFGLFMGLFMQANTLITYAVQPLPGTLAVKWFIGGVVQGVLLGLLISITYKPKPGNENSCPPKN